MRAASSSDILIAVRVLQLLHQAVEVERVRLEIVLEVGALLHARGIELELVGEVRADVGQDLVSRHASGTVAAGSDGWSATPPLRTRSAPAAARRSWVRPTTSVRAPRAASSIARAIPFAPNEPCGTTASRRRPSRNAPPCASGSIASRSPPSAGLSSSPPAFDARARRRGLAHGPQQRVRGALHDLEEDVAGEPVGHDHVGLAGADREALDVAREVELLRAGQRGVGGLRRPRSPSSGSVPLESSATRGRSTPDHGLHERRAHVRELHEVLGPHLDVRAAVQQQERAARHRHERGERRAVDAAGAFHMEQPGRERGAGGAAGDERVGPAGGDGADGLDDRGVGLRAHGARGIGGLGDRDRGVDDLDAVGRLDLGGRAEHEHPELAGRGGERGAARDLGGTGVGAVGVEGDRQLLSSGHGRCDLVVDHQDVPGARPGAYWAPRDRGSVDSGFGWRSSAVRASTVRVVVDSARGRDRGRARARPRDRRRSRSSRTTRCGRRGWRHCGQLLTAGAEILWVDRRLFVRECDCFCFGTAMGGDEG